MKKKLFFSSFGSVAMLVWASSKLVEISGGEKTRVVSLIVSVIIFSGLTAITGMKLLRPSNE